MSTNTRRLGKYELQQLLGSGGMAEVWKTLDTQLRRYVAIKILHADLQANPDFLRRFEREAQVVAALQHPNIVKIHDFQIARPPETDSPIAYMVMDYIEGPTLAEYVSSTSRRGNFPPPADIVYLFTSISMAVDYAHQQGMIHRDLKPANILLDKRNTTHNPLGEPILTDFGLAKLLGNSTGSRSGTWVGTPLYISPEQAMGSSGNERSDIYALGVILYELCTGALPFQGDTSSAIMQQHINIMPTSPALLNPGIRPALTMVILRALAKDPAARFPSAASLTVALAEAFNIPITANLELPAYPVDSSNEPTYFKPLQGKMLHSSSYGAPVHLPPSSSLKSQQISGPKPGHAAVGISTPPLIMTPYNGQAVPVTPVLPNRASFSSVANSTDTPMIVTPSPLPPGHSPLPTSVWKKSRKLIIGLLILLVVLLGSGVGAFLHLSQQGTTGIANQIVGHAYFVSSGLRGQNDVQGTNDELLIDLHNISSPPAGKSYYAWLLNDKDQANWHPIPLGVLPVTNEAAHHLYTNPQHTNWLEFASRLVITVEDANITPTNPAPAGWHYYAEFSQSIVTHLRYLLSNDSMFKEQEGLDTGLFENTQKVFEWAGSARSYWLSKSTKLMKEHFIRILEYLRGQAAIGTDLPSDTRLPIQPPSIALLGSDPLNQNVPDYLHAISGQVTAIAQSPAATPDMLLHANRVNTAINNVRNSLENVYQDAKALFAMNNVELQQSQQALTTLNDLNTQASYAYVGVLVDPTTKKVEPGVVQLHFDVQLLATLDVAPYKS